VAHCDCVEQTRVSRLRETKLTCVQVATGRKSALMGVIGCRTDETDLNGVMEEAEGYENIAVFSECKQCGLRIRRRPAC
jgi:hypothetical protein